MKKTKKKRKEKKKKGMEPTNSRHHLRFSSSFPFCATRGNENNTGVKKKEKGIDSEQHKKNKKKRGSHEAYNMRELDLNNP